MYFTKFLCFTNILVALWWVVCFAKYQFYREPSFCLNRVLLQEDFYSRFLSARTVIVTSMSWVCQCQCHGYVNVNVMLLLRQCHGYAHFLVLMEPQVYCRRINQSTIQSTFLLLSIVYHILYVSWELEFFFWCKVQPLQTVNVEVLQQISNIPTRLFPFNREKPFTCTKMLNGNLPLHAIFLFS